MNGLDFDPNKPRVLVPFDLKRDIIDRLERVEDKVDQLASDLSHHVQAHDEEIVLRQQRRERFQKQVSWAVGVIAALLSAVLGWGASTR
jgi:uncharacterized membrane protein